MEKGIQMCSIACLLLIVVVTQIQCVPTMYNAPSGGGDYDQGKSLLGLVYCLVLSIAW